MHIKIFGMDIIILSSFETANTLMSQASYSDRPILTMVGKLCVIVYSCQLFDVEPRADGQNDDPSSMNFTPSIVLAPYGEHWKSMRRITQQSLNRSSSQLFHPSQLADARLLLQELVVNPTNYIGAIR